MQHGGHIPGQPVDMEWRAHHPTPAHLQWHLDESPAFTAASTTATHSVPFAPGVTGPRPWRSVRRLSGRCLLLLWKLATPSSAVWQSGDDRAHSLTSTYRVQVCGAQEDITHVFSCLIASNRVIIAEILICVCCRFAAVRKLMVCIFPLARKTNRDKLPVEVTGLDDACRRRAGARGDLTPAEYPLPGADFIHPASRLTCDRGLNENFEVNWGTTLEDNLG
jgi:hypothetical protein